MNEITAAITFYLVFSLFGIIGLAFTSRFMSIKSASAYIIAKPLGLIIFVYALWMLASVKVIQFSNNALVIILFGLSIICSIYFIFWSLFKRGKLNSETLNRNKFVILKFLAIEVISLLLFAVFLYFRAFNSSLESTEKFMDLHLLMSSGKTGYFPFFDGWWSSKSVNYYYYGFVVFATLVKISGVPYAIGYNLSMGIIFILCILLSFVIVYKITKSVVFSILGSGLVSIAGNIHYASCLLKSVDQNFLTTIQTKCYYPSATRILDPSYTINEFPSYSFVLGDMHPHVMSIPFFLINLFLLQEIYKSKKVNHVLMFCYAITLATAALVNFWDFMTLGFLFALVFLRKIYLGYKKSGNEESGVKYRLFKIMEKKLSLFSWTLFFVLSPFVLFLPFFLYFKSPVPGIGFSPLFVLGHPEVSDFQYPSTLWFLFGIWGVYIIGIVVSTIVIIAKSTKARKYLFPLFLGITAMLLVGVTEFFYFKDLFHIANPPYFRANTVFKFGYHAWMLFGISFASMMYLLWKKIGEIKSVMVGVAGDLVFLIGISLYSLSVFIYPIFSVNQAYTPTFPSYDPVAGWGVQNRTFTLDGSRYIEFRAYDDFQTIKWLNENQKERVVVLEAAGSSYSFYGRIGVNTGMGNVINWESHEWTWRFHYPPGMKSWKDALGKNIDTGYGEIALVAADVRKMYESVDDNETRLLLKKYNVKYIYVGDLERTTYSNLQEDKFRRLGRIAFESGNSRLYEVGRV